MHEQLDMHIVQMRRSSSLLALFYIFPKNLITSSITLGGFVSYDVVLYFHRVWCESVCQPLALPPSPNPVVHVLLGEPVTTIVCFRSIVRVLTHHSTLVSFSKREDTFILRFCIGFMLRHQTAPLRCFALLTVFFYCPRRNSSCLSRLLRGLVRGSILLPVHRPLSFVPHSDLQQRDPDTFKPLHVVSMTIRDSADDSAAAAGDVLDLCKMVNERAEWRLIAWLYFVHVCLQQGHSGWGERLDERPQAAERSCSSGRRRVFVLERGMGSPKVVVKGRVGSRRRQPNNVTGCYAGRGWRRRFGRALPTVAYT